MAASPPTTLASDDAGVAAFFAKAEAREPLLGPALGFVPAASRDAFRAWTGLLAELRECAFELSDPRVTAVKAGWWAEELDGVARGAARHPLTRVLVRYGGPWRGVGDALLALATDLDPPADAAGAIAALRPFADALLAVERQVFHDGAAARGEADAAVAGDGGGRALSIHWLRTRLERGLDAPDRARVPLAMFARHGIRRDQLVTPAAEALRRDWAGELLALLPVSAAAQPRWSYPRALTLAEDRLVLRALTSGRHPRRAGPSTFVDVWRAWRLARNAALQVRGAAAPST
jgi:hypothetical protein